MRTYREFRGHGPDFVVKYRLYSPSEGGRQVTLQHLRCDFMYEGDDPLRDGIFMIHPEFLDAAEQPMDDGAPVPLQGLASMWVLAPEMRPVHKARIQVGVRGHFMEGSRKVGDVEVVRVEYLHAEPTV